jgi:hypothetical protein
MNLRVNDAYSLKICLFFIQLRVNNFYKLRDNRWYLESITENNLYKFKKPLFS